MRICHIVIFTNSNNTTIESSRIGAFESSQGVRTLVRNGGTIRVSRGGLELLWTVDSFFNRQTGDKRSWIDGIESLDTDRGSVPLDEVVRQGWPGVKITHRGNLRERSRDQLCMGSTIVEERPQQTGEKKRLRRNEKGVKRERIFGIIVVSRKEKGEQYIGWFTNANQYFRGWIYILKCK